MSDVAGTVRARARRFETATTVLIGIVALAAAVLAVLQSGYNLDSARAQERAARLAADASARITASSLADDAALRGKQDVLVIGMQGIGRQIAAQPLGDAAGIAIGDAERAAGDRLSAMVDETAATSGKAPVDPYTAGLIAATTDGIATRVTGQGHAVDVAADTGTRGNRAVLGLSLLALGGVLAGIAAVLKVGRPGWITLGVAWGITGAALVVTVLTVI